MNVRIHTTAEARDYDVVIEPGALDHLHEHVEQACAAHSYAIISDSNVARLYGERAHAAVSKTRRYVQHLEFPAGESNKSDVCWAALSDQLIAAGFARDSCIIALGGGVTTDLAGFVAATFMRGVPVIQVPTSLLAMIDAAIGGKTGIDTHAGKNLIGAFHQPHAVIIDPHLLRTLPDEQLRFGLAEAVKHGAIADAEYFAWLASAATSIFEHKIHTVTSLIKTSVEIKARFVSADVHEHGARAALNFGHTIAHALETVTAYTLAHGEAVSLGMIGEAAAGELAGITTAGTADRLRDALDTVGLPTHLSATVSIDAALNATRADKKTRGSAQRYVLLARIGEVARPAGQWTTPLPDEVVREALTRISIPR